MIPIRLTLHNFMCYRDPASLDFTGLHLACLTGSNGHGKSALLDAMTWALWGKARSNQADDLITLGQTDMAVEFEFALGKNLYRVLRSRQRRGRSGRSDLQLQVWASTRKELAREPSPPDPDAARGRGDAARTGRNGNGEWRPITEPTIRETEQRIVDLLRMDYDTFINSAFLMQGRADEFTIKPPGQRKQILGDILGLGRYDQYEERAKEKARAARIKASQIESQMQAIDQELGREQEYLEDLARAQEQVLALSEELRAAAEKQRQLYLVQQDLANQQRALDDLERQLRLGKEELAEIETQLQADQARLQANSQLVEARAEIERGYEQLLDARQAEQDWNRKLARQVNLQADHARLDAQINQARNKLVSRQQLSHERIDRLQQLLDRVPALEEEIQAAQAELATLSQQDMRLAELRDHISTLAAQHATLHGERQRLKDLMVDIKAKIDMLSEVGAPCPVCNRALGEEERAQVLAEYEAQGKALGDHFRSHKSRLGEIEEERKASELELRELQQAVASRSIWERQEAQAEARLAEAERAMQETEAAQAELAEIDGRLQAGDFAHADQARLLEVEADLAQLGYDADAHERARSDLAALEPYQDRHASLRTALSNLDDLRKRIRSLQGREQRWQQTLAEDLTRRDTLAAAVARLPTVQAELTRASQEVDHLEMAEQVARQQLGASQQRLDACRAQAKQRQVLGQQLEAVLEKQAVYEELQAAFGKKGLQAMIIEAAIPEIETEANRLLSRMTDGRMAVRMETQRETKTTQELRETLDIILSDELGSRDYSLFSGGEAFRANFAIRIALSKLLARRAGAQLQTLIIDEGFGTQDAQGRERLVEAINSIQEDFERILVITHIDELRDHFPARIEVVKTLDGSNINIS